MHDAAINIWEMMMGGTFRRAVRLCDPMDKPVEEIKVGPKTLGPRGSRAGNTLSLTATYVWA